MTAANQFLFENPELNDSIEDHMLGNGWFSSEVLSTALLTKSMEAFERMKWRLDLRPIQTPVHLHKYKAAIQNRANQHWVAYRRIENHYIRLDSLTQPTVISSSKFAQEITEFPHTYGIEEL